MNTMQIAELKVLQLKMSNKIKVSSLPPKIKDLIIDEIYNVKMHMVTYYNKSDSVVRAEFKGKVVGRVTAKLNEVGINGIHADKIIEIIKGIDLK